MQGLVSVIMPTRNRAPFLQRSIDSVLAQTHRDLELIVVNDGSTDTTREVLARYDDPRLRVIHHETGGGAAAARNAGIAVARGEFIAFMDDDDAWLVLKLQKQVEALRKAPPEIGWCLTGYLRMDRRFGYIGGARYFDVLDYRRGVGPDDWSLIATPGWLLRREVFDRAGVFDERIRSWDDWELGLRLSAATKKILVDEPLWIQDWLRGGALIHAERVRARDLRIIMEKHGDLWAGLPRVRAHHWYIIGRAESLYDPAPAGRGALVRSLRLRPLRLKTWAALAASFLGQDRLARLTRHARNLQRRFA